MVSGKSIQFLQKLVRGHDLQQRIKRIIAVTVQGVIMNLWFMGGAAVLDKEGGKIVGQRIQNSGQHAPVSGDPRDSQGIHTVKVQRLIEIGLEKSAEAAFGQPDIRGNPNQPIGHFGALGTANAVFLHFSLENEIPIEKAIRGKNDGNRTFPCLFGKAIDGGHDGSGKSSDG